MDYFEGQNPPKNTVLTNVKRKLNLYELINGVEVEIIFEWVENSRHEISSCLFSY
jgi:hypothetical protein